MCDGWVRGPKSTELVKRPRTLLWLHTGLIGLIIGNNRPSFTAPIIPVHLVQRCRFGRTFGGGENFTEKVLAG